MRTWGGGGGIVALKGKAVRILLISSLEEVSEINSKLVSKRVDPISKLLPPARMLHACRVQWGKQPSLSSFSIGLAGQSRAWRG